MDQLPYRLYLKERDVIAELKGWQRALMFANRLGGPYRSVLVFSADTEHQEPKWLAPLCRVCDIKSFTHIVHLHLDDYVINDDFAYRLVELSELRTLEFTNTQVSQDCIRDLRALMPHCTISVNRGNHFYFGTQASHDTEESETDMLDIDGIVP